MALIQCPECGGQLSSLAESCPHCGMPRKKVEPLPPPKPTYPSAKKSSTTLTFVKVMLGFFAVIMVIGMFNSKDEPKPDPAAQNSGPTAPPPKPAAQEKTAAQKDAECKASLQCWGDKYLGSAGVYCKDDVERLAQFSAKWTDEGWFESKFSRFRWLDKDQGTVTFVGDKVQFQNGFGAYQNYTYECDYDPATHKVIDVRARPGRI